MAGRLSSLARDFCAIYERDVETWKQLAKALEAFLESDIDDLNLPIHLVRARHKSPESLLAKCRDKRYDDPASQATDLVAARVITLFSDDVDLVVARLEGLLEVIEKKLNVRGLGNIEFGYRSAHLLAKLRPRDLLGSLSGLSDVVFEIQVRTVLGHGWAEIEHEEVYKAGVSFEASTRRDLAAIAAMLEFLDGQFELVRREKQRLIARHQEAYAAGRDGAEPMDVARLVAFLSVARPSGNGWVAEGGRVLPIGSDASAMSALRDCGLATANALKATLGSKEFRSKVRSLASTEGVAPDEVSHLAVSAIAVGVTEIAVLRDYPEIVRFADIAKLFAKELRA